MENLTPIEVRHLNLMYRLAKDPADILATLTPEKIRSWHAATGVCGEAGELLDAVKKMIVYNKPLDLVNVIEELGDLEFYMAALRENLGITREACLAHNIDKLNKRYAQGYSDQAAQQRADKAPGS